MSTPQRLAITGCAASCLYFTPISADRLFCWGLDDVGESLPQFHEPGVTEKIKPGTAYREQQTTRRKVVAQFQSRPRITSVDARASPGISGELVINRTYRTSRSSQMPINLVRRRIPEQRTGADVRGIPALAGAFLRRLCYVSERNE